MQDALNLEQREQVCREVLGWTQNPSFRSGWNSGTDWVATPYFECWYFFGLIVDAMHEKEYVVSLEYDEITELYIVGFNRRSFWDADNGNPTVAAALAALKAVKSTKKE